MVKTTARQGVVDTTPQIPFAPSPDAAWSMVYLPDTQNYVKSSTDFHIGQQQTQWIKDHVNDFKIKLVLQGGDIVNNNDTNDPTSGDQNSTQQWQNAKTMFSTLNGVVPYVMAAGNHDFGFTDADNRDTMINSYFKPEDNPLVDPAKGGILTGEMVSGEIQNSYYTFTAPRRPEDVGVLAGVGASAGDSCLGELDCRVAAVCGLHGVVANA